MAFQIGGTRMPMYSDQLVRANLSNRAPRETLLVESDADAVKPFSVVYVNTAHATYKDQYVKNATALYGKGNGEGQILITEPRLIRPGATEMFDKNTAYKGGTAVLCSYAIVDDIYAIRTTADSYSMGEILVCAANGVLISLTDATVGSTAFRGHAFISLHAKTTTSTDPFLAVRYLGLLPLYAGDGQPTTATLKAIIAETPYFTKSGAGSVGTMKVLQYPINAPELTGVTFASSDATIASVDSSTGAITAVANGTAYITATKGTLKAVCIVVVTGISP